MKKPTTSDQLTEPQRRMLLHARRHGQLFGTKPNFPGAGAGGGSVYRAAVRLAKMKLLDGPAPYTISPAGLKLIEMRRHDGTKMPPFWLVPMNLGAAVLHEDLLNGIEAIMMVREMGDTEGVAVFRSNGAIEFRRNGMTLGVYANIAMMFADLPRLRSNRGGV